MSTPNQKNLVEKNSEYAENFKLGDLGPAPAKHYTIVTCMDARIEPYDAFGVKLGDAHIIRNAGGNAKDAVRSLVISQQLLQTKEVLVIKHTDCGMVKFSNDQAHEIVAKNLGDKGKEACGGMDFQPFGDAEQAVKDDVAFLKGYGGIHDDVNISGWLYDVKEGRVKSIV